MPGQPMAFGPRAPRRDSRTWSCEGNSVSHSAYIDRNPDLRAAVADAERLVEESRGTNLDPIIQALDRRLLDSDGEAGTPLVVHLRRDLVPSLDLAGAGGLSGRQVAARLLCGSDDRVRVPLLAAQDGGLAALVPTIAVTVFGGLRPAALEMASALAALVAVRGLGGFCADTGHPLEIDRLGPARQEDGPGDR